MLYGDGAWHREQLVRCRGRGRLTATEARGRLTWMSPSPPSPTPTTSTARAARLHRRRTGPSLEWKQRRACGSPTGPKTSRRSAPTHELSTTRATCSGRFRTERGDPFEQRILDQELAAAGIRRCSGIRSWRARSSTSAPTSRRAATSRRWHAATTSGRNSSANPTPAATSPASRRAARSTANDYVIVGQKVWSTWAQWADYGYLLARTEPVDGAGGITAFILDMHSPGVDVRPCAR